MGVVQDDYEAQRQMAVEGLAQADMLVFSAGSSVSSRDMTVQVLHSLGPPGVLVPGWRIGLANPRLSPCSRISRLLGCRATRCRR